MARVDPVILPAPLCRLLSTVFMHLPNVWTGEILQWTRDARHGVARSRPHLLCGVGVQTAIQVPRLNEESRERLLGNAVQLGHLLTAKHMCEGCASWS